MAGWGATSNILMAAKVFESIERGGLKDSAMGIKNVGALILRTAKSDGYVPVKSGKLRRSGRLKVEQGAGKKFITVRITFGGMGTGVDYALIQEVGNSKVAGKYYLHRAVKKHKNDLIKFNLKAFEKRWNIEVKKFNTVKLV